MQFSEKHLHCLRIFRTWEEGRNKHGQGGLPAYHETTTDTPTTHTAIHRRGLNTFGHVKGRRKKERKMGSSSVPPRTPSQPQLPHSATSGDPSPSLGEGGQEEPLALRSALGIS